MSINGRPLSTKTIIKRLRHLRDNCLVDYPLKATAVDRMGNHLLDIPVDQQSPAALRIMVRDLNSIDNECKMSNAENALLRSVIDNLDHRLEQIGREKTKVIDPVALIEVPNGKPDWMLANEAAQMAVTTSVRSNTIHSLTGAMRIVLDEIDSGTATNSDFEAIVHLARTLQRLY